MLLLPADQLEKLYGAPPRRQFHARLSHRLPSDPAAAYEQVTGAARNLEVRLAGAGLVGDNLGAALDAARSDALYAQILFLFLGLPGAMLAALLTAAITGSGAVRRRADQALLRTRGASTRALVRLALAEAIVVGVAGVLAGLGLAAIIGLLAFGSAGFGATAATVAGGERSRPPPVCSSRGRRPCSRRCGTPARSPSPPPAAPSERPGRRGG